MATDPQKIEYARTKIRQTEGTIMRALFDHFVSHYGIELMEDAWASFWNFPDELPSIEDEHFLYEYTFLVWLFFDFIAAREFQEDYEIELPNTRIAADYMEKHMRFSPQYQKDYIKTVCQTPFSFFLVKDVVPGESITLQDILFRRDVTVREVSASQIAKKGHIIFTKVIFFNGIHFMFGCSPTMFSIDCLDLIMTTRDYVEKETAHKESEPDLIEFFIRTSFLRCFEEANRPVTRRLVNTDGDPIKNCEVYFDWSGSIDEAFKKLKKMAGPLQSDMPESEKHSKDGSLLSVETTWSKKGNKVNPGWDNTLLGRILIKNGTVKISVNSVERAEQAKFLLGKRLGEKATFRKMVKHNLEKQLAKASLREDAHDQTEDLMNQPEAQEAMKKIIERHWQAWPDTPLPLLDNMTAREAAKDPKMREKLQALLLTFESHSAERQKTPWMNPDIDKIKKEIGF